MCFLQAAMRIADGSIGDVMVADQVNQDILEFLQS
jgi:hypothetical protein